MPLPREDIEDLDPTDPADAAILQDEALAYYDQAEEAVQDAQDTTRRLYAQTAYPKRESQGIKLARGVR